MCEDCYGTNVDYNENISSKSDLCSEHSTLNNNSVGNLMSEKLNKCNECGKNISINTTQCPKCGAKPEKECQVCHSNIPFDSLSCPDCGEPNPFKKCIKVSVKKVGGKISSVAKSNPVKITLKIIAIIVVWFLSLFFFAIIKLFFTGALIGVLIFGSAFIVSRLIWRSNTTKKEE